MKVVYILPLFLLLLLACHDEDNIKAELQTDKYNLADDPNDPVQHFIHELYQKNGVVLITNPDTSHYVYNFNNPNSIHIVAPKQEKELLQKSVQFLAEVLFDLYDDNFKKNYFPFTILMADEIQWWAFGEYDLFNAYSSTSFTAVANINDNLFTLDEATKRLYRGEINASLWSNYLYPRGAWKVKGAFYEFSKNDYGEFMDALLPEEAVLEAREYGFISYDPITSETQNPDPDEWYFTAPTPAMDVQQYIQFIFSSTQEELDDFMEEYPVIGEKYVILRESIKESLNIDMFSFCVPS